MGIFRPDRDRKIIPRWRSFHHTVELGELSSIRQPDLLFSTDDLLVNKVWAWSQARTVAHASDLVGAAIVLGREEEVHDAARFLKDVTVEEGLWGRELASHALGVRSPAGQMPSPPAKIHRANLGSQVHELRKLLRIEAYDAIVWVDLARIYAALGLPKPASRCMTIALGLAPDNRFVLRSANRFWIHLDDPEKAHGIIVRSARTRYDPWLLAAEIATGEAAGRTPRHSRAARSMLSSRQTGPEHLSELASALATLELGAGSIKQVRQLFKFSLERPTENSVAQAAWASWQTSKIEFDRQHLDRPNTFEAGALSSFHQHNWREVVEKCRYWHFDQPFSSRPCILGSTVAALALEDYALSKEFSDAGLLANPNDLRLRNNLAFALIHWGRLEEASKVLTKLNEVDATVEEGVILKATKGLLAFRLKQLERGRRLYGEALEKARERADKSLLDLAQAFFTSEEFLQGGVAMSPSISEKIGRFRRSADPNFVLVGEWLSRVYNRSKGSG